MWFDSYCPLKSFIWISTEAGPQMFFKKPHLGHYGLIHIVFPRILKLYKFPPKAFFLILKSLFKKLYQGQYVLTHIVFSRI